MQPRNYGFDENLDFSDDDETVIAIKSVLLSEFHGAVHVKRATKWEDKAGTDFWVKIDGRSEKISIDAKVRRVDFWKEKNKDDLALETWSVVEEEIVGWTRNPKKRTDFVLWYWIDTGRHCLIPFPLLCFVMEKNWRGWMREYENYQQRTSDYQFRGKGDYHSEAVMVPKDVVLAAIRAQFTSDTTVKPTVLSDENGKPKPKEVAPEIDYGKLYYVKYNGTIWICEYDGQPISTCSESEVPYGNEIISDDDLKAATGRRVDSRQS